MIAVLLLTMAGWAAARRLQPDATGVFLAALAFLIGCGVGALTLLILPWNRWLFVLIWTAAAMPPLLRIRLKREKSGVIAAPLQTILLIPAALHVAAGLRPLLWDWSEWLIQRRDFFFIWGYKARLFFVENGIPWSFLRSLPNDFSHPDYPLLVPLLFDVPAVLFRSFDPRAFAVLTTALGLALLLIVHRCLLDDFTPRQAILGALALSGSAFLPFFGFAEGPLVAFAASAALLIRRALRGSSETLAAATVLLGLAAMTKNEGIAFFAAVCIASPRLMRRIWPAGAAIAVWLVARALLHLPTDVFSGEFLSRIADNVAMFPRAFATVPSHQPVVVIASLVALALAPAANFRRERFILTVVVVQVGFYLAAYAVTPHDVAGHVNGSWERISSHVTLLIGFTGITSIYESLRR